MKTRKKAARRLPRSASARKLVLEARSLQAKSKRSRMPDLDFDAEDRKSLRSALQVAAA